MRADAARNIDAVLQTGARLLAADPAVSMAAIAAEAGVDRRTVYRRFSSRDALLDTLVHTKLDALEAVLDEARLDAAPILVALHRLVEGIVVVTRRYPVELDRLGCDVDTAARLLGFQERLAAFARRAAAEGVVRADLPDGLLEALIWETITLFARRFDELEPGCAADIAVDVVLGGIGQR
jgi:AcrR family transcriptional regulator